MDTIKKKKRSRMPVIGFIRGGWYFGITLFLTSIMSVQAEIKTTSNLLVNPDFESGNANGWTLNGDVQVINDCCGSQYDVEFGDAGSIEQDVNLLSNEVTQPMLDNGFEIESSVLVQNGEGGTGGWCSSCGNADEFTVRLQVKDSDQNVLGTHTQSRTETTDINGKTFTDKLVYGGTGGSLANIKLSGTDSSAPARLGGSNIDNVILKLIYDDTVLSVEQTETLQELEKEIIELVQVEEQINVENIFIEEIVPTEVAIEEFTIEEEIILEVEKEFVEEQIVFSPTVVEMPIEQEVVEETITEEIIEEIVTTENTNEVTEEETRDTEVNESNGTVVEEQEQREQNDSRSIEVAISIEDISKKVSEKIKNVDEQLQATQIIVAKVMQKNNNVLNQYSKVNQDIFKQPNLVDRNIDTYTSNTYVDIRNIYQDRTYEDRNGY